MKIEGKPKTCPFCDTELTELYNRQKVEKTWHLSLDGFGNADYSEVEGSSFADDFGDCECPECGEDLNLNHEEDAINFLKGVLVFDLDDSLGTLVPIKRRL